MEQRLKLAGAALGGVIATLAAGGIAFASIGPGLGPIGHADLNNDGEITRAEWLQDAGKRFDAVDANKDGKLVIGEVPPPPPPRHHGPHGPGEDGPDGPDGPPPPPPPAASAQNAPVQPAAAPTAQPTAQEKK